MHCWCYGESWDDLVCNAVGMVSLGMTWCVLLVSVKQSSMGCTF